MAKAGKILPQACAASGVRDPLTTLCAHFALKALDRLAIGRLVLRLPDGSCRVFGAIDGERHAELHIRDWRFFRRVLLSGDIGLAEAYMDGDCDSPDLPTLLALLAENQQALGGVTRSNPLHNLILRFLHHRRHNSREGSRRILEQYKHALKPDALYGGVDAAGWDAVVESNRVVVGSPSTVIKKIRQGLEILRPGILGIWTNDGTISHKDTMRCLQLMKQEVMPALHEMGKELDLPGPFEKAP